jgi:hypothetical protein
MKLILLAALGGLLLVPLAFAEVQSLSQVFLPGRSILDLDGDGWGDKPALSIILPDDPSAFELALAADISARANLESLAVDFGLVRRASEVGKLESLPFPILIGAKLPWVREALRERRTKLGPLGPNEGLVFLLERQGQNAVACVAGSDEALLHTGRAFFLRWPYFWEIWGRETGATYLSLESDIAGFFSRIKVALPRIVVRKAFYEFPVRPEAPNGLRSLSFDQGQIKNLTVELSFATEADRTRAREALSALGERRRRGEDTEVLSYAGCAQVTFEFSPGTHGDVIALPRTGATKRLLTPAFKERPRPERTGKEYDLLTAFSAKGFYADQDGDGIPDGLESTVVIPRKTAAGGVSELASRLMLSTAGGAFPVVLLDSEVESRRALAAPILVGANDLTLDLVKTGHLKIPALESQWGLARVVPKAFGKSSALVITAPDASGLQKTLSYFSRTFPHFDDFAQGRPQFSDASADFERFLKGEKGAAEAWFMGQLEKALLDIKGLDIESIGAEVLLPRPNERFEAAVRELLAGSVNAGSLSVTTSSLRTGRRVFEKEKEFSWEADDALALIREKIKAIGPEEAARRPLGVSLGISESPQVRQSVRDDIVRILAAAGFARPAVEVLSAYKPGFFWLTESVLPALRGKSVRRLAILFAEEKDDFTRPRRTYSEPGRWLQELYPVDEILARELGIPLESIGFEMKGPGAPVYEVRAYGPEDALVYEGRFTPRTREIPLLDVLPEWGPAKVTCGWLRIQSGEKVVLDTDLRTDLEKFWDFYQKEVLKPVYSYVMKKTNQEPTFSKQPYFKRLAVELWASEPDYRIGLDEEVCSSLEAIHDEIYFDTLDFLRGITGFDADDKELPPDTSRSSAPGNVLPSIHPSLEGGPPRVKVTFEDWPGSSPEVILRWKETGHEEITKKYVFPALKPKALTVPGFVYNGRDGRVEEMEIETEWEKEADYLTLIDILTAYRGLGAKGLVEDPFRFPALGRIKIRLSFEDREKEEVLPVVAPEPEAPPSEGHPPAPGESVVPTREIISPEMCGAIVRRLGRFPAVRSYIGGRSYEGRDVPVLEVYLPLQKYVSIPRLTTLKPTLQISARQHANEVSSTNYLLRFAELLARDKDYGVALKKMNFVFEPMENPDGAELAYELHQVEPFHSLHAGRYGSLGVDIGYQPGSKPLLPEAAVRPALYARWTPDIFLNLHGYPSHEWVQPFSNYTPYLFRDYWIPKGWFAYFRSLSLPIYGKWKEAGDELRGFIVRELDADAKVRESNRKFYDRYRRWAARWAPHMDVLEIYDGVNLFAKRRASTENKMSARTRSTYVEETPELMDETATGAWLDFLCDQGLAYLRAHMKYLAHASFELVRLEEESQDRVRITFLRGRPAGAGGGK